MSGVPDQGPLGLVHTSGWMTSDNFIKVLEHLVNHARCTKEKRILLIMDNHESHLSIEGLNFCKENGIVVLTLPPHTSNKLQPLDRTVFGPFKTYIGQAADSWMTSHPGQTLTIYDLPAFCLMAWERAANPVNVKNGFRCTGIVPFDRDVFQDNDFLGSYVTDRPQPPEEPVERENNVSFNSEMSDQLIQVAVEDTSKAGPSKTNGTQHDDMFEKGIAGPNDQNTNECSKELPSRFISPEEIQPFPKAGPRKAIRKGGRKQGRCMIATDTPEKEELAAQRSNRKFESHLESKLKIKKVKRKVLISSSSESESDLEISEADSSGGEFGASYSDSSEVNYECLPVGSFVIVRVYATKGNDSRNYVARLKESLLQGYMVEFFKKQSPSNRFLETGEKASFISFSDIVKVLPAPIKDNRPRFLNMVYFNLDLLEYSLQ